MSRAAAFFDLDKTILAQSASMALTGPLLRSGMLTRRAMARSAQAQLAYHLLDATHERSERVKDALAQMVSGWSVAGFDAVVSEAITTDIAPIVYAEALDAISAHHAAGHEVVIVSASAEAIVRPVMRLLEAEGMLATALEEEDGTYTGGITYYNYGDAKPAAMEALAERRGWDLSRCWAYSDSITDEPMLRAVGHAVAVNPDRALARIAREEGWTIRQFSKPVPLRRQDQVSTAAVLGGVALIVGTIILIRRLKSRT